MMKKILAWLLAVLVFLPTILPGSALAAEDTGEAAEPAADPYRMQSMITLQDQQKLLLPESMSEVTVGRNKSEDGILLTGTVSALTSGRIVLADELDFNRGAVGRVCMDGLSDRDVTVTVNLYLDEEETPYVSFVLGCQMGKNAWSNRGDHTIDVHERNLTGKHKISFDLNIEGKKPEKKTTVLLRSLEFAESSIPVLYFDIDENKGSIDAMNASPDHSVECYGTVSIEVPDGWTCEFSDQVQSIEGLKLEYLRGRGNSTWDADKKPYKMKLDKKTDLFGMGANKHWVLLANRYDNSFVRNRLTYWLGRQMGMEYTPQCVPVEVVMNGKYYGSYLLSEQVRVGSSRVDIDDLEADDESMHAVDEPIITGGYLLSMSPYGDEDPANMFETNRGVSMFIESPSFEEYNNEVQRNYIRSYIQATEDAICGKDFKDQSGKSYTEYLDLDAAAKYWWIQEFSANGDAYGSGSTFLYKKRNGKLFWGPLWDFDYVAWGNLDYDVNIPDTLQYTSMLWFDRMRNDPVFTTRLKEEWTELKALLDEAVRPGGQLDQYAAETAVSREYDHEKWGSYGEYGWWGYDDYADHLEEEVPSADRSYTEEIEQFRSWITGRKKWIDENLDQVTPKVYTVTFKANGKILTKVQVPADNVIEELPEAPAKKGYTFVGW